MEGWKAGRLVNIPLKVRKKRQGAVSHLEFAVEETNFLLFY
jgi:hypothetical protein